MNYRVELEGIDPRHLRGFFVGWRNPPSPQTHLEILRNSAHAVLAVDNETDQVVGFITAISDGLLSAYIPLLEVLPEYQGQGIGSELLRRMFSRLEGLYMIDLVCDPDKASFYERLGMQRSPGMIIRNFEWQAGNY